VGWGGVGWGGVRGGGRCGGREVRRQGTCKTCSLRAVSAQAVMDGHLIHAGGHLCIMWSGACSSRAWVLNNPSGPPSATFAFHPCRYRDAVISRACVRRGCTLLVFDLLQLQPSCVGQPRDDHIPDLPIQVSEVSAGCCHCRIPVHEIAQDMIWV
jgi:hypothetical protein